MQNHRKNIYKKNSPFSAAVRTVLLLLPAVLCLAFACPAGAGADGKGTAEKKYSSYEDFSLAAAGMVNHYNKTILKASAVLREFGTGRLIMKGGEDADLSDFSPVEMIRGPEGVCLMQFRSSAEAEKAYRVLRKDRSVSWVEPDRLIRLDEPAAASGSLKSAAGKAASSGSLSWGVSATGADVFAKKLLSTPRTVKVAVIDSGVSSHPFLRGRLVAGYDYIELDSDASDVEGGTGHGTHVAGTIVDCTPGLRVKIMPIRVMDGNGYGDMMNVVLAIRYAVRKGAKVINLSLTGSHSKYMDEAVSYAVSSGCVVVAAAGNFGSSASNYCPSHLEQAIVVSAVNQGFNIMSFSNYGPSVDVSAPGNHILSCIPGGGYSYLDGTSMAVPHVSAVAAMLKLAHPSAAPKRIEALITSRAKDRGAAGWDRFYGYGVVQAGMFNTVKPSSVRLDVSNLTMEIGGARTLKATVSPYDTSDKSVTWTSSQSAVATVNSSGKVTAKKAGKTVITAKTINGKTAECVVTVKKSGKT